MLNDRESGSEPSDPSQIVVSTASLSDEQLAAIALAVSDQAGDPVPPHLAAARRFWRDVAAALNAESARRLGL